MSKMAHDHLGPSSIQGRRKDCPGSYHAELAIPEDEESEASPEADAGHARHYAGAEGLLNPDKRDELLEDLLEDDRPTVSAWWDFWEAEYAGLAAIYPVEEIRFLVEEFTSTTDGRVCTLDAALVPLNRSS